MPFWSSDHSANAALNDPKRKFRFKIEFDGIQAQPGGPVAWYAKTVTKPSFQITNTEHKYLNHTFYYPGAVQWQDVSMTLVDPVNPDVAATLSDIIVAGGYSPPADATDLVSMSKAKATNALGVIRITQLDADGNHLEEWRLWNAFITEIKYGDLEYGADDLTELSLTLKYDWATITTPHDKGQSARKGGTGSSKSFTIGS